MIGIYKITSPTNKIYIGQSINIEKRFKSYFYLNNVNQQRALFNSFKKHGVENHNFEIIEECEIDKLNERERYWQDYYDAIGKKGLNCFLTKTTDKSGKISKETRLKMSISAKKKIFTEKHKDNIREATIKRGLVPSFKGMKHSKETKELLSKRQIGELNHNYNKKASLETRKKMSSKSNGSLNPMYGKKHSIETINKIQKNRTPATHKKGKTVLNTNNGIYYEKAKDAANSLNINYVTLSFKLNGRLKNNTSFIYV